MLTLMGIKHDYKNKLGNSFFMFLDMVCSYANNVN